MKRWGVFSASVWLAVPFGCGMDSGSPLSADEAAVPDATMGKADAQPNTSPDGAPANASDALTNTSPDAQADTHGDAAATADASARPDSGPLPRGDFTVHPETAFGPITRLIYGHNWPTATQMTWKSVGRFGGNPLSVFNWRQDFFNTGSDYYFEDQAMASSHWANWEDFVVAGASAGAPMLIVVPTLGWVAKGPNVTCSYPFSQFPKQRDFEHTYSPDGGAAQSCALAPNGAASCCGNGQDDAGAWLNASVDLDAGYTRSSPDDVVAWLRAIRSKVGDTVFANVMVGLDNEPDWWNTTHHDVHPAAATLDEIWNANQTYAIAIKAAFPALAILGPDLVRWSVPADVKTYLDHVAAYRMQHAVQLIDYLDLHFYPAYGTFSFGCAPVSDAPAATKRMQSPRLFWDPTYSNPYDGITTEAVALIPRYKQMIASTQANVKLAITEYNLGTDMCAAGALAQAEAFAVFGRYGLDLATRWSDSGYVGHYALTAGSPAESAFRMYLEHDVTGASIDVENAAGADAAASAPLGVDSVTAYAVLNGSTLNVLLFNKRPMPTTLTVQLGRNDVGAVSAFGFTTSNPALGPLVAPLVTRGLATVTLAAASATLLVATLP